MHKVHSHREEKKHTIFMNGTNQIKLINRIINFKKWIKSFAYSFFSLFSAHLCAFNDVQLFT